MSIIIIIIKPPIFYKLRSKLIGLCNCLITADCPIALSDYNLTD